MWRQIHAGQSALFAASRPVTLCLMRHILCRAAGKVSSVGGVVGRVLRGCDNHHHDRQDYRYHSERDELGRHLFLTSNDFVPYSTRHRMNVFLASAGARPHLKPKPRGWWSGASLGEWLSSISRIYEAGDALCDTEPALGARRKAIASRIKDAFGIVGKRQRRLAPVANLAGN